MVSTVIAGVLAGVGLLGAIHQDGDSLRTQASRFYMTQGGNTLIEGFATLPFDLLSPLSDSSGARAAYRFRVRVLDSGGNVLANQDWSNQVPARFLRTSGASTVEHFQFAVPEGTYRIETSVTDSASGNVYSSAETVEAFEARPLASDVLLTSSMRRSMDPEEEPAPGEIRKGAFFISGSAEPELSLTDANLYHYVELYPGDETTVEYVSRITDVSGQTLHETGTSEISLSEEGGVLASGLNLTGLPPGEYRYQMEMRYPDTSVVRHATFRVGEHHAQSPALSSNPFANMTEVTLDSLYAPLVLVMDADERGVFDDLSVEGKRNFLSRFWESRDPTPSTPRNEAMQQFYSRIAEANRRFGEGGAAGIPGWRTDRGRIFLKYGEPDEFLEREGTARTQPYIVWKYTRGRPLRFIFYDETGFDHYVLIYTDDRSEQSRGNWEELLGTEAVQDALRF